MERCCKRKCCKEVEKTRKEELISKRVKKRWEQWRAAVKHSPSNWEEAMHSKTETGHWQLTASHYRLRSLEKPTSQIKDRNRPLTSLKICIHTRWNHWCQCWLFRIKHNCPASESSISLSPSSSLPIHHCVLNDKAGCSVLICKEETALTLSTRPCCMLYLSVLPVSSHLELLTCTLVPRRPLILNIPIIRTKLGKTASQVGHRSWTWSSYFCGWFQTPKLLNVLESECDCELWSCWARLFTRSVIRGLVGKES